MDTGEIEILHVFERVTQAAVQGEFCSHRKCARRRYAKIGHEAHHRRVGFIDLAVQGLRFAQRRFEDLIQDLSLVIVEYGSQRVGRFSEMPV